MKGKEFFENIRRQTGYVNPNGQINDQLIKIASKFETAEILNDLIQTRRGGRPGKDLCQILFICEKLVYEIVFTSTTLEFTSIPVKSLIYISIKANNDQETIKGKLSGPDELRLIISNGDYTNEYVTGSAQFEKLLHFRDALIDLSR